MNVIEPPSEPQDTPASTGVLPLCAYMAFALVLTFPLVRELSTAVPNDPGDPLLNAWILWWNATTLPLSPAWWSPPAFFPSPGTITFSEHLLGLSLLTSPVQWAGGGPLLAYNLAFLLSFPVAACGMFLLVHDLTGRRDAAFIAGFLFGFAPYRIAHLSHLQVLWSGFMPIALAALHRYLRDHRPRWLAVFAVTWTLQSLSNGYYLAFFSVLLGLWLLWFVRPPARWRALGAIALAWGAAAAAIAPLLWTYRETQARYGFARLLGEMGDFSADLASLLDAAPDLMLWGGVHLFHRPEGAIFPGLAVVAVIAVGAVVVRRSSPPPNGRPLASLRWAFALLAVLTAGVAVSFHAVGPWEARLLGLRLFSVSDSVKPLTEAIACLLAWLATTPRVTAAFARRSVLGFYAVAAVVMWLLSLGPAPTVLGTRVMHYGPYWLLTRLPGFDALRVPARFAMLTALCTSVVCGLLFARFTDGARRLRAAATVLVAIIAGLDTWIARMPLAPAPAQWRASSCLSPGQPLLHLPLGDAFAEVGVMYQAIPLRAPTVNGYSGFSPPASLVAKRALAQFKAPFLHTLASYGVRAVVLEPRSDPTGEWQRFVASALPGTPSCAADGLVVFRLPPTTAPRPPPSTGPDVVDIAPASIRSDVHPDALPLVRDGRLSTGWLADANDRDPMLVIDLGSARTVSSVVLSRGRYAVDFPPDLIADTSDDGRVWTERWRGDAGSLAFAGALRNPLESPMEIDLGRTHARFLRLRPDGGDAPWEWPVAELRVFGAPTDSRHPEF